MQRTDITWRPIEDLALVGTLIEGDAADSHAFLATMREGRERPTSFDDALIQRILRVYTERMEFITIYREQLLRWQLEAPTPVQRVEIARLSQRVDVLQEDTEEVLRLAQEIQPLTIDAMLRMSDVEVGLRSLLGEFGSPTRL